MEAMKDRTVRILNFLSENKSVKITLLAEILDISIVTLRKDLDNLEKRGIVRRTHGYVSLDGADNTGKRIAINYSIKRRIAKAAAQIIEEGENILIESGSCCAMLAEELALERKNINIITNSVFIANYACKLQNLKITLLGGSFQPESQVLIGPITKKCAEQVYSNKLFLGTDGFIPEYGFTGRDHLRAETAAELANHAKEIYILTEASKFKQRGSCKLLRLDRITGVFTDNNIPNEAEKLLVKNNIHVHKVPAAEEKFKWQQFSGMLPILYKERVK